MILVEIFLDLLFLCVSVDDDSKFVVLGGVEVTECLFGRIMKNFFSRNSACYIEEGMGFIIITKT